MQLTAIGKRWSYTARPHQIYLAMKFTVILLIAACMQVSASGYSQSITLKTSGGKLGTVMNEIANQSQYRVFYQNEAMKNAEVPAIDVKQTDIAKVLEQLFRNQPYGYEIANKTIVVSVKKQKPAAGTTASPVTEEAAPAPPPSHDISGKLTNEKGEPLHGASIKIKGTQLGTSTNTEGIFTLKNVDEKATLEFSFVGYETISLPVGARTSFVFALKVSESNLQEVVVNKGYYTEKQRNSLGNTVHIDSKTIEKQPVQNPMLALQGRVPGLEITQSSGLNGGGITMRIQGINSINSGRDPLVVVDGVLYPSQLSQNTDLEAVVKGGSPLNFINPNDIESIDVLKDADATAIYGSKAANGAILITTKKGKIGASRLSLSLRQGWGDVSRKVNMLNTRQYLDMRYEAYKNDGTIPAATAYDLTVWDTTRYTDWQKVLIGGTQQYTNYNASLSGGTSALQYYVGATYNRQTDVFPGDFANTSGSIHYSISSSSANQRLKMQFSGSYQYGVNNLPGNDLTSRAVLFEPNAPAIYNPDGSYNWAPNASGTSTWDNPLAYANGTNLDSKTKNLVTNLQISYEIFKGLQFTSNLGFNNTLSELYSATRLERFRPEQRASNQRVAIFGNRDMYTWSIEPQLQYRTKVGKGMIDAMVGTSIQKNGFNYLSVTGSGYQADLLMNTLKAAPSVSIRTSNSAITKYNAAWGRIGYTWDDKYLINVTARRDGSNKFGEENRFHNFASVAVGWIFSEEKSIRNHLSFLNFGKLRASYGTTGNDQVTDFSYLSIYTYNNPAILYQQNISLNVATLANPFVQWELTKKMQFGADLGFFNDRLTVSATYSMNRSNNQLVGYPIPSFTGGTTVQKNLDGVLIQNTSVEAIINSENIKTKNFSWKTGLNFTIPRNKVVSYPDYENSAYSAGDAGIIPGYPIGVIKAARFAGINPASGTYMVMDKNGNIKNGSPLLSDRTVMISPLSEYYGGISNTLSYKGIQLDFLFQFVRKSGLRDMYFNNGSLPGVFSVGNSNQPISVLERWQKAGDNGTIGRYTTSASSFPQNYNSSDAYYSYDASYVRLKNIALSWRVPERLIKRMKMQSCTLSCNAQNLLTFTNYLGLDPETMSSTTLPPLRVVTFGLNVQF